MLVGVLTMAVIGGAALIEKAKINNIIEDLQNYDNAYTRFAIQFNKVPGSLDIKTCQENIGIFKKCTIVTSRDISKGDTVSHYTLDMRLVPCGFSSLAMMQLEGSGLLANITDIKMETGNQYGSVANCTKIGKKTKQLGRMRFNRNIVVFPLRLTNGHNVDYPYANNSDDLKKYRVLDRAKVGTYYFFIYASRKNTQPSEADSAKAKSGAFSSYILKKVDTKIDDGMPRRGKVQGIKIHSTSCYDKAYNEAETANVRAQYISEKKPANGCNALFFLSDFENYVIY